ncbi:MAG: hypothetical protein AAB383_01640 [Patescibacteria group bacterium]
MKKNLASLAFILTTCGLLHSPLALADNGYSGFDVSEILDIDTNDNGTNESTDIYENIQDDAKENNTSVAAALILRVINVLTLLIATFTFITIMIGGFMMVTAAGDESKIDRAKSILTQSVIGMVLAFFSYFIAALIQSFFY